VKAILCPCEDITRQEVLDAVAHGYPTVEDVKRYTGLATGSCQGRLCLGPCVELLAEVTGHHPDELGTIRYRPPAEPVPLGLIAAAADEEDPS
jgi:NAD(P)H-nitrite reductase large subunit